MKTINFGLVGLLLLVGCSAGGLDNKTDSITNQTDPTAPCEAAGGSCVAVYPGTCATGHSIGAEACGDGVGVFCCVPDQPVACAPLPAWKSGNPAGEYCVNLGYTDTIDGSVGTCHFPDGTSCEEWSFMRGECGGQFSFCGRHGGVVSSQTIGTGVYAICTLPSGASCKDQDYAKSCTCAS